MWFRIAALLGCTVEEAQQRMTHAEYVKWCGLYMLEPWGTPLADFHTAQIVSGIYGAAGHKNMRPTDFIRQSTVKKRMSGNEIVQHMLTIFGEKDGQTKPAG